MINLNVASLLGSRGVDNASKYLVQKGMKYHTVNRLLMGKTDSMSYATLEQLCILCNCTPDELFVWVEGDIGGIPKDHPLHKLKAKEAVVNPVERIKRMSPAKLAKLREFMDGLERE